MVQSVMIFFVDFKYFGIILKHFLVYKRSK